MLRPPQLHPLFATPLTIYVLLPCGDCIFSCKNASNRCAGHPEFPPGCATRHIVHWSKPFPTVYPSGRFETRSLSRSFICPNHYWSQMFILRKLIEHNLRAESIRDDDAYFCSLSSKTVVYKGQLTPEQARMRGSFSVSGRIGEAVCLGRFFGLPWSLWKTLDCLREQKNYDNGLFLDVCLLFLTYCPSCYAYVPLQLPMPLTFALTHCCDTLNPNPKHTIPRLSGCH